MATIHEIVSKRIGKGIKQAQVSTEFLPAVLLNPYILGALSGAVTTIAGAAVKNVLARRAANGAAAAAVPEQSLSEFARSANLEPRVMIEDSLAPLPSMPKFMMALVNIYAAYYLQTISLIGSVNNISVLSVLDRFNPNRSGADAVASQAANTITGMAAHKAATYSREQESILMANESLLDNAYVLPNYNKTLSGEERLHALLALENFGPTPADPNAGSKTTPPTSEKTNTKTATVVPHRAPTNDNGRTNAENARNAIKAINDLDSLAVGRMINVDLKIDGTSLNVPVSVRMRPMSVPRLLMKELASLGDVANSWSIRWNRFRAGELTVAEWMLCVDILRHKRKLMAMDTKGLLKEMVERRKNHKIAAAATGRYSIGSAASFIILSKELENEIELELGTSFKDDKFTQRVFNENSAMMIVVIDREWERVTMYTRGIAGAAEYSFKEVEGLSKGNGPDISDILKAYMAGSSPRF